MALASSRLLALFRRECIPRYASKIPCVFESNRRAEAAANGALLRSRQRWFSRRRAVMVGTHCRQNLYHMIEAGEFVSARRKEKLK